MYILRKFLPSLKNDTCIFSHLDLFLPLPDEKLDRDAYTILPHLYEIVETIMAR